MMLNINALNTQIKILSCTEKQDPAVCQQFPIHKGSLNTACILNKNSISEQWQ